MKMFRGLKKRCRGKWSKCVEKEKKNEPGMKRNKIEKG